MNSEQIIIHTIGHGRHSIEHFLELLARHRINLVCDVRSIARSRWPQYNSKALAAHLAASGIGYEHLPECGGKVVAPTEELARGLDRIVELGSDARVAILCSESKPLTTHLRNPRANCHRVGLLSVPLRERGARIIHILPDGETLEIDESTIPSAW